MKKEEFFEELKKTLSERGFDENAAAEQVMLVDAYFIEKGITEPDVSPVEVADSLISDPEAPAAVGAVPAEDAGTDGDAPGPEAADESAAEELTGETEVLPSDADSEPAEPDEAPAEEKPEDDSPAEDAVPGNGAEEAYEKAPAPDETENVVRRTDAGNLADALLLWSEEEDKNAREDTREETTAENTEETSVELTDYSPDKKARKKQEMKQRKNREEKEEKKKKADRTKEKKKKSKKGKKSAASEEAEVEAYDFDGAENSNGIGGKIFFWATLIIALPFIFLLALIALALYVAFWIVLALLMIVLITALIGFVGVGVAISFVGIVYGVLQIIKGMVPVGLFEIGLGVVVGAIVLFVSILIYNFAVRLIPFIMKQLTRLLSAAYRGGRTAVAAVKGACERA